MPFFTGLKRFLTVPEPLLAVLKLSPALQFTRYFFTLLKLTSLVGVAIIWPSWSMLWRIQQSHPRTASAHYTSSGLTMQRML
jgi:hypothetical protein